MENSKNNLGNFGDFGSAFSKGQSNFDNADHIPALRYSTEGQAIFNQWRHDLEIRMRGDHGLSSALESHIIKYRKLMPSLSLIFHLIDYADGQTTSLEVSEKSAIMAALWCEYLETHAKRIYGSVNTSAGMQAAKELSKHIKDKSIYDGITIREICRHKWSFLTTLEEVKNALGILEDHHWVRIESAKPSGKGGRISQIVRLNPKLKI
jgi:hypothetical protein